MSDSLLVATAEGEQLTLAGTGAWIAENAHSLEAMIDAETARRHQARRYRHGPGRPARYLRRLAAGAADAQLFRARLRHQGDRPEGRFSRADGPVSYTHLRAHETD